MRDLKDHFEDSYNRDTQEQVAVHRCGSGVQKGNYFEGEPELNWV